MIPLRVIVNDENGNVIPNIRVAIALSNPQLGFVEYTDPELRDTTNAFGRVNMVFTAIGTAGNNVISATAVGSGTITTRKTTSGSSYDVAKAARFDARR